MNRIAYEDLPLAALVEDPVQTVLAMADKDGSLGLAHPSIPLPGAIYGPGRANSRGLDLAHEATLASLAQTLKPTLATPSARLWLAEPLLGNETAANVSQAAPGATHTVLNPADRADAVGRVRDATLADVETALRCATEAAPAWAQIGRAHV